MEDGVAPKEGGVVCHVSFDGETIASSVLEQGEVPAIVGAHAFVTTTGIVALTAFLVVPTQHVPLTIE
jgi:hypothetical protein